MRRNLFHCSNSQQGATDKVTLLFGITIFVKFLLFDFIWSIPTTFASFSTIEFYATKIIATLVLLVPYKFFRLWKTEIVIMLLLDILLIVNLMYFRTYYTAIPLNSYGLSGNLADFTGSVYDSFRWYDIFLSPFIGITKEIPPEEHHTSITEELWESVSCCLPSPPWPKEDSRKHTTPSARKPICVQAPLPCIPSSEAYAMTSSTRSRRPPHRYSKR